LREAFFVLGGARTENSSLRPGYSEGRTAQGGLDPAQIHLGKQAFRVKRMKMVWAPQRGAIAAPKRIERPPSAAAPPGGGHKRCLGLALALRRG
jgi:hypothetical protein